MSPLTELNKIRSQGVIQLTNGSKHAHDCELGLNLHDIVFQIITVYSEVTELSHS